MNSKDIRPIFKEPIKIEGSCLLLVGPIGTFFSRLSQYFEKNNVKHFKVLFPLHEYGFKKEIIIKYSDDIKFFKLFLKNFILKKKIKHIFMYGNVLIPHKQCLELVDELKKEGNNIRTHIFELGYLRPNFITLEERGVNYTSSLIQEKIFYSKQIPYNNFPIPKKHIFRFRKIWKAITFISHCLTEYQIVESEHKLQPRPSFLYFQLKGFFLKYYFKFSEYKLKKKVFTKKPFFLVILQVSTDSQITSGSMIKNNCDFIYKVIKDFSSTKLNEVNLVFKHHPRDRGYTNYSKEIEKTSKKFNLRNNVFYIHDYFLSKIFKNPRCKGTVLINSTVGYQSLYHSIPVKALGKSPFNIDGLSDQKNLASFFKNPNYVDKLLFNKFYKYVLERSQINGNFDGYFPFDDVFIFKNK